MKTCYRIITDDYAGFEVQIKKCWWPFWVQMSYGGHSINTFASEREARQWIEGGFSGSQKFKSTEVWRECK